MNSQTVRKFRRAFIAQNTGHDFQQLKKIASELVFVTTGYEEEEDLALVVQKSLHDFDPELDVVVPVGNVYVNLLIGGVLNRTVARTYLVALFRDKEYHTRDIRIGDGNGTGFYPG